MEPRLLLSAEALGIDLASVLPDREEHDLLVRLVEETRVVEQQSVAVQRVELLDRSTGDTVLVGADLNTFDELRITGTAADDLLTIDTNSFVGVDAPIIAFTGGDQGGEDRLLVMGDTDQVWRLSDDGSGTVQGPLAVAFSGVEGFVAGGGFDTLHGDTTHTSWLIDGDGSGQVSGYSFGAFESLVGAADNEDTFTVSAGGRLAGTVDGGDGGFDTLVVDSGATDLLTFTATAPDAGTVSFGATTIRYAGLEPVTATGTATDVVYDLSGLADANNNVTLTDTGGADGMLLLRSDDGDFESTTFANPLNSLKIILGPGVDNFVLESLDAGFDASLEVDAGLDRFLTANDTITVSGNISLPGENVTLTADTINVDAGVSLSTSDAIGAAGDITLKGRQITVSGGASLLAEGATTSGTISLTAEDISKRVFSSPIAFVHKQATVDVSGATIRGGDIKMTAAADDSSALGDLPVFAKGFVGNLVGLLNQIPGSAISALLGIDLSVVLRGADSKVSLDDATIVSSKSVDIASTSKLLSDAIAISVGRTGTNIFQFAGGFAGAFGKSEALITGSTTITAADNVSVSAKGDTTAKTTARATSNLFGQVNEDGTSIALAISNNDLTAHATVGREAAITATSGNVNIVADGKMSTVASASTVGFVDGKAGIGVGLDFEFADIQATVDGQITAGGSVTGGSGDGTFNPLDAGVIDLNANTIKLAGHGFKTGQLLTYAAQNKTLGVTTDGTPSAASRTGRPIASSSSTRTTSSSPRCRRSISMPARPTRMPSTPSRLPTRSTSTWARSTIWRIPCASPATSSRPATS